MKRAAGFFTAAFFLPGWSSLPMSLAGSREGNLFVSFVNFVVFVRNLSFIRVPG
jgi:hypothetical protein